MLRSSIVRNKVFHTNLNAFGRFVSAPFKTITGQFDNEAVLPTLKVQIDENDVNFEVNSGKFMR
jgi:hypothetical protein